MKKVLLVSALVMMIVTSMVSGTLAVYTTSIPTIASGIIAAKNFVLVEEGTDTFTANVNLAPTEKKDITFAVNSAKGSNISEVGMHVDITVSLTAAGRAIAPLTIVVYKGTDTTAAGTIIPTSGLLTDGVGDLKFSFDFAAMNTAANQYTVVVTWPDGPNDYAYAGHTCATLLKISATGTQI